MEKSVVICGFKRSPMHLAGKGALAKVRPDDMAAEVIKALVKETKVNVNDIEDLIMGNQPRRSSTHRRRTNCKSLLRLVDDFRAHCCRPDSGRRGRGVHLRGRGIDDTRADGRI